MIFLSTLVTSRGAPMNLSASALVTAVQAARSEISAAPVSRGCQISSALSSKIPLLFIDELWVGGPVYENTPSCESCGCPTGSRQPAENEFQYRLAGFHSGLRFLPRGYATADTAFVENYQ